MSSEFIRQRLEGKAFCLGKELLHSNEIPSVAVWGETLPEAWENAVLATWEFGAKIPTEYDQPEDPDSRDVSLQMTVVRPFKEPRIHRSIPDSFEGLAVYVAEVVDGVHDYKVNREGHGWSYSYHDRIFNYPGKKGWEEILGGKKIEIPNVNQIESMLDKLAEASHTRRAQAITWIPQLDQPNDEPPCLQRIWCRIVKTPLGHRFLEMNTNWRSNDALKAAFMNTFGLTELQRSLAREIEERTQVRVGVGRYVATMDSFHIYGSYLRKLSDFPAFLHQVESLPFERRVIATSDPRVQKEFEKARAKIEEEKANAK